MDSLAIRYNVPELIEAYRKNLEAIRYHAGEIERLIREGYSAGVSGEIDYKVRLFMQDIELSMKQKTWNTILAVSGLEKYLSIRRYDQFEKFLYSDHNAPEPTAEAIEELLAGGAVQTLFEESILEIYDFLRQGAKSYNKFKTNEKSRYEVGKKVILDYMITPGYIVLHSNQRRWLVQIDKIFHILDGKPFDYANWYNSPLVDGIIAREEGETEYFAWKRFQNGNLHLTFKRDDLLETFNHLAGRLSGNQLKGD